jgi:hypothetical protein
MPDTEKRTDQARRKAERLICIRLRYAINTHLEDRGLTTPAGDRRRSWIAGGRGGQPLTCRQWREGDVAARLGLDVPLEGLDA